MELRRKIEERLKAFYDDRNAKALMVTGARQVGKTHAIEHFLSAQGASFATIDFIEQPDAAELFSRARSAADIIPRLSLFTRERLVPGETIIFLDEIQRCKELVTAIKYLVQDGRYRYILSGSLPGVELYGIRSVPVGYMDSIEMFPLDLEEFAWANGVSDAVINELRECFVNEREVDSAVHNAMTELFKLYLVVGGMPEAVSKYMDEGNLQTVFDVQSSIVDRYRDDIAQYSPERERPYIKRIFDMIPAELGMQNKRFIMRDLDKNFKLSRNENTFVWLSDAGVALPTYAVDVPAEPLKLSCATNKFKLFLSDVGLLSAMYMNGIQVRILKGEKDINFGAVYENWVAEELKSHGFELYYYNSKRFGELDFVVEREGKALPIEVKSGKGYTQHRALSNVLAFEEYSIEDALVLGSENISRKGKILYAPIYMAMFLERSKKLENPIYRPDLSALLRG